MTDYNKYKAEGMERLQMYGKAIGIIVMIGLLFYKSIVAILLFLPFSVWLVKYQEKQRMKDRKWEFNQQFKQGLLAISSSLNAGYSVENAFGEAVKDLELVYEEKTDINISLISGLFIIINLMQVMQAGHSIITKAI